MCGRRELACAHFFRPLNFSLAPIARLIIVLKNIGSSTTRDLYNVRGTSFTRWSPRGARDLSRGRHRCATCDSSSRVCTATRAHLPTPCPAFIVPDLSATVFPRAQIRGPHDAPPSTGDHGFSRPSESVLLFSPHDDLLYRRTLSLRTTIPGDRFVSIIINVNCVGLARAIYIYLALSPYKSFSSVSNNTNTYVRISKAVA